jgi:ribosomal protection tetracycline resistance protein
MRELAIENLADIDEEVLNKYLDESEFAEDYLFERLKRYIAQCILFPLMCGVAKNGVGVEFLLDAIVDFLPPAKSTNTELSALVYKIEHEPAYGRLAHIRLFGGELRNRDLVLNHSQQIEGKVSRVLKYIAGKLKDVDVMACGDTGVIAGLKDVRAGDILGKPGNIPELAVLQIPFLTTRIKPAADEQYISLAEALMQLNLEDPNLDFNWYKTEKELHLKLMGNIQMEVLQSSIKSRFDIDVVFEKPMVIYKETPKKSALGYASYTMPKPCWAVLQFKIEPGAHGSGITYDSVVSVDKVHQKYQNEIEQTIPKALEQGIKGWEVTDIKVTLVDGEDHVMHSRPGDFILATPMAIMDALTKSDTNLLEPMMQFEIKAGEEHLGSISSDLHLMRGEFANPEFQDGKYTLKGKVPASTSMDYSLRFNSVTGGKGKLRLSFSGHQLCPEEFGQARPYRGVNPLDRSQWILHARGAFKADDRKM